MIDGSSVAGGIDRQNVIFDVLSIWKVLPVSILLHVCSFLNSLTRLWGMIILLWMCKSRTHHAKGWDFESGCKTTNTLDIIWPIDVKWESENLIRDKVHWQNLSQWYHTCHSRSGQCSIPICPDDHHHAAFIPVSNCIILHTDLVHMVEIVKSA